jgi:hypothetical protein
MEPTQEENGQKGPLVVYTIVARERDGRKFWVRIGSAFRNRDGSLNAVLDAIPTNGTIHIRAFKPFTEREREADDGRLPFALGETG